MASDDEGWVGVMPGDRLRHRATGRQATLVAPAASEHEGVWLRYQGAAEAESVAPSARGEFALEGGMFG